MPHTRNNMRKNTGKSMENELWGIPIEDLAGGWWFNHVFLQSG